MLVVIWLLYFVASIAHGYKTVYCTDLVPPGLSIELLDTVLFLLGGDENTVEMLVSDSTAETFKDLLSSSCLNDEAPINMTCYSEMREAFMKKYRIYSPEGGKKIENETSELIRKYEDKAVSVWNNDLKKFFTVSCLIMCWAAHTTADSMQYEEICPNPCKIQKACSFEDCKRLGIFGHQYECICSENRKWDYETHACLSQSLINLRTRKTVVSLIWFLSLLSLKLLGAKIILLGQYFYRCQSGCNLRLTRVCTNTSGIASAKNQLQTMRLKIRTKTTYGAQQSKTKHKLIP